VYLAGGDRRSVCELCTSRAIHEGWVREGTVPAYDGREAGSDRRRSLFGRWRAKREGSPAPEAAPTLADELEGQSWAEQPKRVRDRPREPRHVRAIPTSVEHKIASAVELFNGSEHRRTVAGVARSLGPPTVSVRPADESPSLVNVVVSWELCWYRYEADLSDEVPGVRLAGQGYELDELPDQERLGNAVADDRGVLALSA
jgi:hypothetical protein